MAKRIRISIDAGVTYFTFPGNSGQLADDVGAIDDTIFGQNYSSSQPGLIAESFQTNGMYKGFAGYVAKIKQSGAPTSFTAEAFTLVSGKTYKISNSAKNVWNRSGVFTFKDNAVVVPPTDILSIDYLLGQVTLTAGHTVAGAITADGSYLPTTQVANATSFTLNMTANTIDKTDFINAQASNGQRAYDYGLKTVSIDLGGFYNITNAFRAALLARSELIIEINPDGSGLTVARGWFKPSTHNQSGNVGALEAESMKWNLYVPDQSDVLVPFEWNIDVTSTLNTGIKNALNAWQNNTKPLIQYLWDGTNGYVGSAVITSVTLTGGLEVMNDFAIHGQYDGALTSVP